MKIRVHTKTTRPFRRAGIEFGRAPAILDIDDLTEEQVRMLQAEPMLVIERGEETPEGDANNAPKKPARGKKA